MAPKRPESPHGASAAEGGLVIIKQPTLPYPPTLERAREMGDEAQSSVERHANGDWLDAAYNHIWLLTLGTRFIAEDVVIAIERHGHFTVNRKAIGPIISRAARQGLIVRCGARAARTSHGSLKPEWIRI